MAKWKECRSNVMVAVTKCEPITNRIRRLQTGIDEATGESITAQEECS